MATQPSNKQQGDVYSSLVAGGNYPADLRKEGVDEAAKLTYLTRDINFFTSYIHRQHPFTSKRNVTDRVFKVREIDELTRFYTVQKGTGSGNAATTDTQHRLIALTNNEAAEVQPNNIFFILGLFATVVTRSMVAGQVYPGNAGVSGTSNVGPDLGWDVGANPTGVNFSRVKGLAPDGNYYEDYEQVKVVSVGAQHSAGTGYTLIELERCYMGPGENDAGGRLISRSLVYSSSGILGTTNGGVNDAGNTAAIIVANDILLRGTPVAMEGTNAPNGVYKNPTTDENFTQEYKYAIEKTKESDIVAGALYIKENAFDISRWLTTRQMNRDREYSNLLGRKMRTQVGGREEFISGGVRPWIMKDSKHIIVYPGATITWPGILDLGKLVFGLGGSSKRIGFTGITMDAELRKSFWNEHLFYNKEVSGKFNMEVNTLVMSGGTIDLIVSQVMEENGFGNEILCLDLSNSDSFEPVTNAGWDMKVDKGPGGQGIQEPGSMTFKEQIIGMYGLKRRYKSRHCIIDFSNAVSLPPTTSP